MSWAKWVEPWYAVYGLLGIFAAGILPMLLPQYINETGDTAHVGIVMAVFNVGGLSAPLWGYLADRQLHKPLVLGALAVTCAGSLLIATSTSVPAWLVLAFLLGAGITAVSTVAGLLIVERHPRAEWDQRMGWLLTAFGGGQVVGLLITSFFSGTASAAGLLVGGGIALLAGLLGFFLLPASPKHRHDKPDHFKALAMHVPHIPASPASAFHHLGQTNLKTILRVIRTPFGIFLLGFGLLTVASGLVFTPYPLLFQNLYGVEPSAAAVVFGLGAAIAILWYPLAGNLGHRLGDHAVFNGALIARTLCFLALVLLMPVSQALKNPLASLSFIGIVNTWPFLSVSATVLVASLTSIPEGEAMGIYNGFSAIMATIGALLSGLLAAQFGYGILPIGAAVIGFIAIIVMLAARSSLKTRSVTEK